MNPRIIAYYDTRYITGRFGDPRPGGRIHEGTDFSHSRTPGLTPVPALVDGTVAKVWVVSSFHGYGNRVDTATAHGEVSYAHLHARSSFRVGDRVAQGDIVGHEGMSGFVSGSCCHVEHAVNGRKRDPLPLIRDVLATSAGGGETPVEGNEEPDMLADEREALFALKVALLDGTARHGWDKRPIDLVVDGVVNIESRMFVLDENGNRKWDAFQELLGNTRAILAAGGRPAGGELTPVDVDALAAALIDGLGAAVAADLAKRLID